MRSIKRLMLLSLLVIVAASCQKSSTTPQNNSSGGVSTAADVIALQFNGVAMSSAMPQAIYSNNVAVLQLSGLFNSSKTVEINIKNPVAGVFAINANNTATFYTDNTPAGVYTATNGTISISSITSNSVSGTFEFSGTNINKQAFNVTAGQFQAHLITL